MPTKTTDFMLIIAWAALIIAGCAPPTPKPAITPVEVLQTQAAGTVIAQVTMDALLTPSATALATGTSTATTEPTPTATATALATATVSVTPTKELEIILQDDFSTRRGWATQNQDDFGFGYLDEEYTIYVRILNATIWSIRGPETLTDARIETLARRYSGATDGYYGVVCRHQDEDNYYALLISDSGMYGIARMLEGEFEFLSETRDDQQIIKAGEANQISGDCLGNTLTLTVNGTEMLALQDSSLQSGSAGLAAKTNFSPDFQAVFQSFLIAAPK